MKVWIILFFLGLTVVHAESFSQVRKVSLEVSNQTLLDVLDLLQERSGYTFLFSSGDIHGIGGISLNVKDKNVEDVLNVCLQGTGLVYELNGELIVLKKQLLSVAFQVQKKIQINGIVRNKAGEALPGVSILLDGTSMGITSTTDGTFKFDVPEMKDVVLVFSFVGMKKKKVVYKGEKELSVVLEEDVAEMEEVVVTGIFSRKQESFTGSSATFTSKELKMVGNQNVLQSLKTLDPSFAIIENNEFGSDPNSLPNIEIRGKSSVIGLTEQYGTDPNQPLFILDGFESSLATISDLSMDRVQSITVLKDAAATAIYGSKAANGVVVVETKKPEIGKLRVNYNGNLSFNFADLSDYNLMNSAEKLEFERLAGAFRLLDENGNILDEECDSWYNEQLKEVQRGVNTYWMNEPLRFATTHKHTLSLEGGDTSMRYGAGVTYGKTQGVMKGSDRDVLNGNVRLLYRNGRTSFNNSLNLDYSLAKREPVAFSEFSKANPYYRKYNELGEPEMRLISKQLSSKVAYNPLYDMENKNVDQISTFGITNNTEIEWRVVDELTARVRFGLGKSNVRGERFRSPFNSEFDGNDPLKKGSYNETNNQALNYDGDINLTYGKVLKERHTLNVVGGIRFTQNTSLTSEYAVEGFIDDEFSNPTFALGYKEGDKASYKDSKRRTASYYLNIGYSYDNRYLLDGNYRSDGSSVFGSSESFSNTWSVGLGWNIHNEHFMEGMEAINQLKLRASVGNPGNQNFDDYISMRIYGYNNQNRNPFGSSVIISTLGNNGLSWQKTLDRNAGLDIILIKNRLRVNVDYFYKQTAPLLVYVGVPSSSGSTSVPRNLGKQVTKGMTLNMAYTLIRRENVTWSVNMNLRHLTSEYQDMNNALEKFNTGNRSKNLSRYYDGGSPTDLWAVRSCGIDPATGREIYLDKNGNQTFKFSYDDEVVVGNSDPKVEGVFGTSFYYKGFSASFSFRYRFGGQIFMSTLYDKVENISYGQADQNLDKRALYDRWQKPGDEAKFKSIAQKDSSPMSSRFVEDNNVLSGESVSLGYETEGKWLKAIGASSMTVRGYMNDIFRISTVKNERGLSYPFARSVSFSLGVRF